MSQYEGDKKINMNDEKAVQSYFKKDCEKKNDFYSHDDTFIYHSINRREMWKIYRQSLNRINIDNTITNTILDAGCGIGQFILELNKVSNSNRIIGLDFLRKPLIIAQKNKHYFNKNSFFECDLQSLCFKDKSIDIIFCLNVLHHLSKDKLKKTLKELSRVCKKILVLEIRNKDYLFNDFLKFDLFSSKYKNLPQYCVKIQWIDTFLHKQGFLLTDSMGKRSIDFLCRRILLIFERDVKNL